MDTRGYNVSFIQREVRTAPPAPAAERPVPVINNPSYVNVLPSVSLRYPLSQESDAAWSMAAACPARMLISLCPTLRKTIRRIPQAWQWGIPS